MCSSLRQILNITSSIWSFDGLSSLHLCLLYWGDQNWTQYSKSVLSSAEWTEHLSWPPNRTAWCSHEYCQTFNAKGTSLTPILGVHQDPLVLLFQAEWPTARPGAWGSSSPDIGLCTSPCWTLWCSYQPISPFVEVLLNDTMTLALPPVFCHQETQHP